MCGLRIGATLLLVSFLVAGCSDAGESTEVNAVVAPHFSHEGLETGDSVGGATLRLYANDTVVLETVLDDSGSALIVPEPGNYDVQVSLDSSDPGCFWGDTVFGVVFPSAPINIEVGYICAGQ
jgi:hypothetical protein